jgi:hypothetical protein
VGEKTLRVREKRNLVVSARKHTLLSVDAVVAAEFFQMVLILLVKNLSAVRAVKKEGNNV